MEVEDREVLHNLEKYREVICNQIHARRLLDRMRSRCVFTKDECEEILNEVVNPNSSTKAGCFLDNLQRKGSSGYNVFMECLGEMYPSLYKIITGKEAEAPISPISNVYSCAYKFPGKRVGDMIGDLSQEVEDMHRELDLINQLKFEQDREIQSLNQALTSAREKAQQFDKVEKGRRRAELKVSVLEADIRTLLGNSLLHKEEKDQAMESLREKIKEVHELERRLQQAKDQTEVRRQLWHKTCMDKQQLKVDREEMLQRMSTMEEELKQAKRNEDVRKSMISAQAPEDCKNDQHMRATINILEEDLNNYKEKCEELAGNLLRARSDLHRSETEVEKYKSENEELKQKELSAKQMVELYKTQYSITWQDLNRVKQQRNRAIDERDMAQMDSKAHFDQLHKLQEMMNVQLKNLQTIHQCQPCPINSALKTQSYSDIDQGATSCKIDLPVDFTDGISANDGESLSSSILTDLPPPRPRGYNIFRQVEITDQVLMREVLNENTFPVELFSYTPSDDATDETHVSNQWVQRHHADTLGESRRVHPGSRKSPHLLSLWEESFIDDGGLNEMGAEKHQLEAEEDEALEQPPV